MRSIDVLVIGGGQAGLALSRCLSDRGTPHVVIERGRVGQRWRSERRASLTLLTPRWMSRLPGMSAAAGEADGFMTASEVAEHLDLYARSFAAPVIEDTEVLSVRRGRSRFAVMTSRGPFDAGAVVIATGSCQVPLVPDLARSLDAGLHQVVPAIYEGPRGLPPGGVLVVGASATGVQLAAELRRSGRPVTLAVGRHTRLPRTWRGRDIFEWLEELGILDERAEEAFDLEASREQPSLQLVGSPSHATLDLGVLQELGVRLAGRLVSASGSTVRFADDLPVTMGAAEAKLARLVARIEAHAAPGLPPAALARLPVPATPLSIDLRAEGISTVVWATGYRRRYDWLHVPVLDARGEIQHLGGVTPVPGLYVLGLPFLRRRRSSYLDGVGRDAGELADIISPRVKESA